MNESSIKVLVYELKAMKVNKWPCQDVILFGKLITDKVIYIKEKGSPPLDLNLLVANNFHNVSVLLFNLVHTKSYSTFNKNLDSVSWSEIISELKYKYQHIASYS